MMVKKNKISMGIIIASIVIFILVITAFVFLMSFKKISVLSPQQQQQLTEDFDHHTNPDLSGQFDVDSDADGWSDSKETELGSDPNDASSTP